MLKDPRPLVFTPENLRSVLNTRPDRTAIDPSIPIKWQTRRVIARQPVVMPEICRYGAAGDRVYFPEPVTIVFISWADCFANIQYDDGQCRTIKLTVSDLDRLESRKNPYARSIARFMLRSFARHFARIDQIRVERINDISERDAVAEGVPDVDFFTNLGAFRRLWNSINESRGYGFESGCWVWAIDFTREDNHAS